MPRVLLVEDDPFLSSLLKNKLTREGFEVIYAKDGDEAVDLAKKGNIDLMMLDLILPKKSGFEVIAEIKKNPETQGLPVVIISNLGQEEDAEKAKELGAVGYFIKAKTSIDDLVKNVKEFVKK
jgi:DNA-binding response OmpR family regulator